MFRSAFRFLLLVGLFVQVLGFGSTRGLAVPASRPELMPPHPGLADQIANGEVQLPKYMTDVDVAKEMGIDAADVRPSALTGSLRALAVVVDFSDKVKTVTASYFDSLIFAAPVAGRGSVRDYFNEISYGQIDIVTLNLPSSIGWVRAPHSLNYYSGASVPGGGYCINAPYPNNCQKLAEDVVDAIQSVVDFSKYDNNNDGYTEPVMIIHAGKGAEFSGSAGDIWSHSWGLKNARSYDGKIIRRYVIMPEYMMSVSTSTSDMTIGVFAHEMGHGFWSLPDLYDTDNSSQGIGEWSLMAGGSWNGPNYMGGSPAWPDAWTRTQMGIATPTLLKTSVTGQSFPQPYSNKASVFRVGSLGLGAKEYYLLENREKVPGTYDEYLPGSGLLIWHIDEAMFEGNTFGFSNDNKYECEVSPNYTCSDTQHYGVSLHQADGLMSLEKRDDYGNAGDPFPGTSNVRSWTMSTAVDSSSWYGSTRLDTCIGLNTISNAGATMTANVVTCGVPANLKATTVSQTQINLAWTDTTAIETGFKVERSPNGTTGWAQIGTTSANIVSYSNTGLACGSTYYYRVRSYNASRSNSEYSNVVKGVTTTCSPAAPSTLTASPVSQTQIKLAWKDNSTTETGFKIERSLNGSSGWAQIGTVGAGVVSYLNSGLTCNTPYYYRVRAYNAGGNSAYTTNATTKTLTCLPSAPASLHAMVESGNQVLLIWLDKSTDETGFKLERYDPATQTWKLIASLGAGVVTFTDTNVVAGSSYTYRVYSYNGNGNSAYSNEGIVTIGPLLFLPTLRK